MQISGDPVPSVGGSEPTGEIAELYAGIRVTLGMSFVNLIWRNFASIPAGRRRGSPASAAPCTPATAPRTGESGTIEAAFRSDAALRRRDGAYGHPDWSARKARGIHVSLPRNLAQWPGLLVVYCAESRPLHDDGSPLTAIRRRAPRPRAARARTVWSAGPERPARRRNRCGGDGVAGQPRPERDEAGDPGGEPYVAHDAHRRANGRP
jgi:hypothetical protein